MAAPASLTIRKAAPAWLERWYRPVVLGLVVFALAQLVWTVLPTIGQGVSLGRDLDLYLEATRRWAAGGSFYRPEQLAGPYAISMGDVLYPPYSIVLFAPFTILPGILWWAPLAVIGWVVYSWHPSPLAWAAIAVCATFPNTLALTLNGNPVMWAAAFVALGTRYRWPAALAVLKPTVAIVGLLGARDRRWWLCLFAVAVVSVPFGRLWLDYLAVLGNVRGSGLLYSLGDLPIVAVPLIAWLNQRSQRPVPIVGRGAVVDGGDGVSPGRAV